MKRTYQKPKAVHVDFQYEEQVTASSQAVALFGDPDQIGRCQQSNPSTGPEGCRVFWTEGSTACQMKPFSLR